ncbi:Propanoyl-CoA C-acyltransferase [Mycolicibacterium rhodesiae JS60]|nr:Propanoyl-CoA C-acyltransferase [Mycolicibacterium rhodesiae JS60]
MTDKVVVVGVGKTQFGELFAQSYADLVIDAALAAVDDARLSLDDIDAAWLGTAFAYTYSEEGNAGTSLAEPLALYGRPVTRVSNYCATGMDAVRQGAMAVAAGASTYALVVGAEKMRDVAPRESLLGQHIERGHPVVAKGRTAPGIFGLIANRYSHAYADPRAAMTAVAIKNHQYGADNPRAHLRKAVSVDQVEKAGPVSGMLRLLDCCPTTDGAAAVVLTTESRARELGVDYTVLAACELAATAGYFTAQFDTANDFLGFSSTRAAASAAYAKAGVTKPLSELDVVECHDCFTITELVDYEDLGLAEPGKGYQLALSGETGPGGALPVNTSGGLQSCGHPIGASGVRMIVDVAEQLMGRCESGRQVPGAELGLAHALGGPGSVATVTILASPERAASMPN